MLLRVVYVFWCVTLMALAMYGLRLIMYSQGQDFALGTVFGFGMASILLYFAGKID